MIEKTISSIFMNYHRFMSNWNPVLTDGSFFINPVTPTPVVKVAISSNL